MKRRIDIITPDLPLTNLGDEVKVFLAGPCQGAPEWQENVPPIPGVVWLNPRKNLPQFSLPTQLKWETTALRIADIVVFWIPAPEIDIPGRSYAQTTRTEIGETLGRSEKTIIFGAYPDFPGREYLRLKIREYGWANMYDSWEGVEEELRKVVKEKLTPKIFFTSDTHFSEDRARILSQRPFKDTYTMDWAMISRWNSVVGPKDTVYHLGDFGKTWPLKYLNGKIYLIPGNHDIDLEDNDNLEILKKPYVLEKYNLSHEPSYIKDMKGPKLFGHIHGRQKVKPWEGVDVGMDAWGFRPVSKDEVDFLLQAIPKYDNEVWD